MSRTSRIAAAIAITVSLPGIVQAQKYYARQNLTRLATATPAPTPTPTPTPTAAPGVETGIVLRAAPSSGSACIQIAEVEVYAGGVNVAAAANGGSATGSSSYSGESTPDKAIDGVKPAGYPNIFHSGCYGGEFLQVTFARPVAVERVVVYGREDYGHERDIFDYSLTGGGRGGVVDARSGVGSSTPS